MSTPGPKQCNPKELLLQALETRWKNYCSELETCQAEFSVETVHDLRVATRRILALIQLLNSISPQPRLKKMSRAFKSQLDEFDELRDTQVILEELTEILPELPQLQGFQQHLLRAEDEMLQILNRRLKQREMAEISARIRKTSKSIETYSADDLKSQMLDAVDDAFLVTRQRLGWVDIARSATIHRVRVAFKAFRYMVETVHPLVENFPSLNLKQMNSYQTVMGNIQDAEVFAQTLAAFLEKVPVPGLDLVHCYCEQRHSNAISVFLKEKDQLHTFWRPSADEPFPWESVP